MIDWDVEAVVADFYSVAALSGTCLPANAIDIECLPAPHAPPTRLPSGKMAVYVFSCEGKVIKVGKVGAKSQARYTSQHYTPASAPSTLAASLLADAEHQLVHPADMSTIRKWMTERLHRVNLRLDAKHGINTVTLLEVFLHCRLRPRYEGFKSQRL